MTRGVSVVSIVSEPPTSLPVKQCTKSAYRRKVGKTDTTATIDTARREGRKEIARAAHRHPGEPTEFACHATPRLTMPCLLIARRCRRRRASNVRYARQAVRQPQSLRRGCGCLCPGRQGPDNSRSLALRRRRRSVEHGPPSERSLARDRATRKREGDT